MFAVNQKTGKSYFYVVLSHIVVHHNYNVTTSNGVLIAEGGMLFYAESTMFMIPSTVAPSLMPSIRWSPMTVSIACGGRGRVDGEDIVNG
jgi:hypothetical protein